MPLLPEQGAITNHHLSNQTCSSEDSFSLRIYRHASDPTDIARMRTAMAKSLKGATIDTETIYGEPVSGWLFLSLHFSFKQVSPNLAESGSLGVAG
jgi:hypothetical protein